MSLEAFEKRMPGCMDEKYRLHIPVHVQSVYIYIVVINITDFKIFIDTEI